MSYKHEIKCTNPSYTTRCIVDMGRPYNPHSDQERILSAPTNVVDTEVGRADTPVRNTDMISGLTEIRV